VRIGIDPDTKLDEVLAAFPELEGVLTESLPVMQHDSGRLIWRSVTKAATLGQIARVAGISFEELVQRLQSAGFRDFDIRQPEQRAQPLPERHPDWVQESPTAYDLVADDLIKAGRHPLGAVREHLKLLHPGEMIRLTSSFYPAPLIDVLRRGEVDVYSEEDATSHYVTYIRGRTAS
jgi:hypothetical protein